MKHPSNDTLVETLAAGVADRSPDRRRAKSQAENIIHESAFLNGWEIRSETSLSAYFGSGGEFHPRRLLVFWTEEGFLAAWGYTEYVDVHLQDDGIWERDEGDGSVESAQRLLEILRKGASMSATGGNKDA
jgi:hypothetical protein